MNSTYVINWKHEKTTKYSYPNKKGYKSETRKFDINS